MRCSRQKGYNEIATKEAFSHGPDIPSEMNDTRQSKSVIVFISLKFHFFWKALNISTLPELILHGIQIANTYNGVIEILKSSFR
jgi:hypothetical protein